MKAYPKFSAMRDTRSARWLVRAEFSSAWWDWSPINVGTFATREGAERKAAEVTATYWRALGDRKSIV